MSTSNAQHFESGPLMINQKIRVLIVDDSAVTRQIMSDCIGNTPDMEVVGLAEDGPTGIQLCRSVNPDVVTLDIQMPEMDGLAVLEAILAERPVPVIMVSALTKTGATVTLEALDRGALDYLPKPESSAEAESLLRDELVRKIRLAAGTNVRRVLEIRKERKKRQSASRLAQNAAQGIPASAQQLADKCIAIGISTGGPPALSKLFESLTPPMPPIVVVQHMPRQFTKPLAWRLNSLSRLSVAEASTGDVLRPNHVLIAPGGRHMELKRQNNLAKVVIRDGEPVSGHKPSVDVLMCSAAEVFGPRCLGVIMTGMGRDGVQGCAAIRAAGGFVLGQDEASSDVYGMNKVAYLEGHVHQQFSLDEAAAVLVRHCRRLWCRSPAVHSS